MAITIRGRKKGRERLVKANNQKVTGYSINTVNGWLQITPDRAIDMKKLEVPGLVEVVITSIKVQENTTEDGRVFTNKKAYATNIKNIDSDIEFEDYEQAALEAKLLA